MRGYLLSILPGVKLLIFSKDGALSGVLEVFGVLGLSIPNHSQKEIGTALLARRGIKYSSVRY